MLGLVEVKVEGMEVGVEVEVGVGGMEVEGEVVVEEREGERKVT